MIPFRRGKLRARSFLLTFVMGLAMAALVGCWGALIAAALGVLQICLLPPKAGVWRFSAEELSRARWFDRHSVVFGGCRASFGGWRHLFGRTVYRDEVAPEQFSRLRRRCFGLPD